MEWTKTPLLTVLCVVGSPLAECGSKYFQEGGSNALKLSRVCGESLHSNRPEFRWEQPLYYNDGRGAGTE
jgi:hypothetical protein